MRSTRVSVIVPFYQGNHDQEWFDKCLASIPKDVELITIDDSEREGAAAARNRGLDQATGEYVMFCDSDDYLEPGAVNVMLKAIEGVDMVCGSFRKFGDFEMTVSHPTEVMTPWQIAKYTMLNLLDPGHHQMMSGCWAKLYRRELVGRFPLLTTAEDMAFNFDYLRRCNKVRFVSDVVYHNRKHKGSLTTTFDEKNTIGLFGFIEALKYVKNFLSSYYPSDEIENALDSSKVYHAMLYFSRIAGCGQGTFRRLYP